jgi:hypothetical protein
MAIRKAFVSLALLAVLANPVMAAKATDPDWPCMQRKVPKLLLAQVWNGGELSPAAAEWSKDKEIPSLVEELASRRVPLGDAQQKIKQYAAGLSGAELKPRMEMLVQGLFERMDGERSHVMAGISRYARKQVEMAAMLRKQASEAGALRNDPSADAAEVDRKMQALAFETRAFQERSQSLKYVCEVPAQFEQRLYALLQTVAKILSGN